MTEQQAEYQHDTVPLGRRLPPELAGRQVGDNPYGGAGKAADWVIAAANCQYPDDCLQPDCLTYRTGQCRPEGIPGHLRRTPPTGTMPPPPLPQPLAPLADTEKEFQSRVVALAQGLGWRVYHAYDSRRSEPGFPDLVMVRERVIFAELKTDRGRLSQAQSEWLERLTGAGGEVYVWRPADWDAVLAVLTGAFAGAGAGQPQQSPAPDVPPELPPCWNCGAAPRVTAASMLCAGCGGGGVA